MDALSLHRLHFAFTITYHYLVQERFGCMDEIR